MKRLYNVGDVKCKWLGFPTADPNQSLITLDRKSVLKYQQNWDKK